MTPKYPDVHVNLSDQDGNAFSILGCVQRALKRAGVTQKESKEFTAEATSGNYDHLLQTVMQWVETD